MKRSPIVVIVLGHLACAAGVPASAAIPHRDAILAQARHAYYSLRRQGLVSFDCKITPDWRVMPVLRDVPKRPVKAMLGILDQIHFAATLAADSNAAMTFRTPHWTGRKLAAINKITSDTRQAVTGFFTTWKSFMLDPPLPRPGSAYRLTSTKSQFLLRYRLGDVHVRTTLQHGFAVKVRTFKSRSFKETVQPQFVKTAEGLVMIGYSRDVQSRFIGQPAHLDVTIGNAPVDGLELVKQVNINAVYGVTRQVMRWTFSDCWVTRKH